MWMYFLYISNLIFSSWMIWIVDMLKDFEYNDKDEFVIFEGEKFVKVVLIKL